jgi:hypothetical protein
MRTSRASAVIVAENDGLDDIARIKAAKIDRGTRVRPFMFPLYRTGGF